MIPKRRKRVLKVKKIFIVLLLKLYVIQPSERTIDYHALSAATKSTRSSSEGRQPFFTANFLQEIHTKCQIGLNQKNIKKYIIWYILNQKNFIGDLETIIALIQLGDRDPQHVKIYNIFIKDIELISRRFTQKINIKK